MTHMMIICNSTDIFTWVVRNCVWLAGLIPAGLATLAWKRSLLLTGRQAFVSYCQHCAPHKTINTIYLQWYCVTRSLVLVPVVSRLDTVASTWILHDAFHHFYSFLIGKKMAGQKRGVNPSNPPPLPTPLKGQCSGSQLVFFNEWPRLCLSCKTVETGRAGRVDEKKKLPLCVILPYICGTMISDKSSVFDDLER